MQPGEAGERREIGDLGAAAVERLQPGEAGERREIGDLGAAAVERSQPGEAGERREIGDPGAAAVERLQPGEAGDRREIGDPGAAAIERLQPGEAGERREIGERRSIVRLAAARQPMQMPERANLRRQRRQHQATEIKLAGPPRRFLGDPASRFPGILLRLRLRSFRHPPPLSRPGGRRNEDRPHRRFHLPLTIYPYSVPTAPRCPPRSARLLLETVHPSSATPRSRAGAPAGQVACTSLAPPARIALRA